MDISGSKINSPPCSRCLCKSCCDKAGCGRCFDGTPSPSHDHRWSFIRRKLQSCCSSKSHAMLNWLRLASSRGIGMLVACASFLKVGSSESSSCFQILEMLYC